MEFTELQQGFLGILCNLTRIIRNRSRLQSYSSPNSIECLKRSEVANCPGGLHRMRIIKIVFPIICEMLKIGLESTIRQRLDS